MELLFNFFLNMEILGFGRVGVRGNDRGDKIICCSKGGFVFSGGFNGELGRKGRLDFGVS